MAEQRRAKRSARGRPKGTTNANKSLDRKMEEWGAFREANTTHYDFGDKVPKIFENHFEGQNSFFQTITHFTPIEQKCGLQQHVRFIRGIGSPEQNEIHGNKNSTVSVGFSNQFYGLLKTRIDICRSNATLIHGIDHSNEAIVFLAQLFLGTPTADIEKVNPIIRNNNSKCLSHFIEQSEVEANVGSEGFKEFCLHFDAHNAPKNVSCYPMHLFFQLSFFFKNNPNAQEFIGVVRSCPFFLRANTFMYENKKKAEASRKLPCKECGVSLLDEDMCLLRRELQPDSVSSSFYAGNYYVPNHNNDNAQQQQQPSSSSSSSSSLLLLPNKRRKTAEENSDDTSVIISVIPEPAVAINSIVALSPLYIAHGNFLYVSTDKIMDFYGNDDDISFAVTFRLLVRDQMATTADGGKAPLDFEVSGLKQLFPKSNVFGCQWSIPANDLRSAFNSCDQPLILSHEQQPPCSFAQLVSENYCRLSKQIYFSFVPVSYRFLYGSRPTPISHEQSMSMKIFVDYSKWFNVKEVHKTSPSSLSPSAT